MNSSCGTFGADIATLEFFGAGGAFASFDLVEGANIRDHYDGYYCNTIADGTPSASFDGGVRLDRQTFVLPTSFAGDTLTQISFIGTSTSALAGAAFLAAMTVESVPEPSSLILCAIAAISLMAYAWRRTRMM
jgi:hypothetical protein